MHLEPCAFFDDAGKWHDRDFVCLCGYISDGERWSLFNEKWHNLVTPKGLTRIHMANFFHETKKLGWSTTEQQDFLLRAARIVRDHILVGFSVGIDAKHYRSLPPARRNNMPYPHVACLQRVLRLISDRLSVEGYEGRITFVLDEEEGSSVEIYKDILKLRKTRTQLSKYIGAICFADDEFYAPLQASDMLANLSYAYLRDRSLDKIGPSLEDMPEVLRALVVDPDTNNPLDMHQELWTASEMDRGIDELLRAKNDDARK